MQQGIPKASTTQQFFPPKNSLQQLYWTKRSQEPFPCPPPKQKKTKQPKNHNKLPTVPPKTCFFFYLSNWTLCVSQDVAAQAGNSALISLAWSDHPAGEVGSMDMSSHQPMTYHVFGKLISWSQLICFFSWGWLATQLSSIEANGFLVWMPSFRLKLSIFVKSLNLFMVQNSMTAQRSSDCSVPTCCMPSALPSLEAVLTIRKGKLTVW